MSALRTQRFFLGLVAAASTAVLAGPTTVAAEGDGLPGMCSAGVPSPLTTLNAHANGDIKFILNLETDADGEPSGVLIVEQGKDRLYTDALCNFWEHQPGQEQGGGHDGEGHMGEGEEGMADGATIAHAVGIGYLSDGTKVLLRADVRETDEGAYFRARYRAMGQHAEAEGTEGAENDAWTWVAEGWLPLDRFTLH